MQLPSQALEHLHLPVLQPYLLLPRRLAFTVCAWNMLHTVEAYAKHAFAPGICTSRIFALAMCSWRVRKQNYGRVKKTSFFPVSDMHCAIPSPPPALLLCPRGKVARKI